MGLDAVELVIAVEKRFDIAIRDDEAESIYTVGHLIALIAARRETSGLIKCRSFASFLAVRTFVRDFVDDATLRLRPSTPIASVILIEHRRKFWKELQHFVGYVPPLRRPAAIRHVLFAVMLLSCLLPMATMIRSPEFVPLAFTAAGMLTVGLFLATQAYSLVPPIGFTTMGDLTRCVTRNSVGYDPGPGNEDILPALKEIISEQLGVNPDKVTPAAAFVNDLGLS